MGPRSRSTATLQTKSAPPFSCCCWQSSAAPNPGGFSSFKDTMNRLRAGGGGGSSAIPGVDADAVDWAQRVQAAGGTYTSATLAAVSNFCVSAKASGYWAKLGRVNLFCGEQLTAALVPLKIGAGSSTETNTNFVSGDYTVLTGLTGNTTSKSLDTGVPSNTFTAADRHLAAYIRTRATSGATRIVLGAGDSLAVNQWSLADISSGTSTMYRASSTNTGPSQTGLVAGSTGGFFVGSGTDVEGRIYLNGGSVQTLAIAAATPSTATVKVMAFSAAGTAGSWYDGVVAGYSIGTALTAAEITAYNTHMETFQDALGRGVV